jgi:hypothetical protein
MKFLSFEILYIFFNLQIFKFFETWTLNYFLENFDPLPMVYRPPTDGISTPPTHGILTSLPMEYRPHYPWYIDPPTYGILTPLPMVYWTPYHVPMVPFISTPLSMVFWSPYTWYFDLPAYLLIRNLGGQNTLGVQFTIQGGSVFNKGVQYTMDVNWPRVQFTMGFKIPYDTGS